MTAEPTITDADRNALAAVADTHPNAAPALTDPADQPPVWDLERRRIPAALCAAINGHVDAGHGVVETAEHFGVSRSTVERHADAVDYRGPCTQHSTLDRSRCVYMREAARDGVTRSALAEQFDCDTSTVTYHVRGRCACGSGVPEAEFQG